MTHTKKTMTLTDFTIPQTATGMINTQKAFYQLVARPPFVEASLGAAWDDAEGDLEAFFAPIAEGGHAGYLAHRDAIKGLIRALAQNQKTLARLMRTPGGDSAAQVAHAYGAHAITLLIEIRHAGKAWSAAQRAARDAASVA